MKKNLIKEWIPPGVLLLSLIILWELFIYIFKIKEYVLPSPDDIFNVILKEWRSLFSDLGITMVEAFLGFIIGNIFGIVMAVIFVHSKLLERSFYPLMVAFKAVPLVAIAPILILWFGFGLLGKIIMAATICFFPAIVNTAIGLRDIDAEALDLMHSYSATKIQIFKKLRFFSALPYIFSALKISSTLSVVGAIVAEMAGSQKGIGYTILMASYQVDTPLMFSGVIMASIGGIVFFGIIAIIEKKVLYWHESFIL